MRSILGLILAAIFGASNLLVSVNPVTKVIFRVESASGFSTLKSLVDFFCRYMFDSHVERSSDG